MGKGDKYENLSRKEYHDMIRPNLIDLANDHKNPMELTDKENNSDTTFGEWKIQLVMLNNCISSKNFEEICSIYSASNNIDIFMGSDTDDIIDKFFDTILQRFQEARETSNERGSEFIHESVGLLYYYFHKTNMKRVGSYIESHELLINKQAAINPKNEKDNKCFQYAITLALIIIKLKKRFAKNTKN